MELGAFPLWHRGAAGLCMVALFCKAGILHFPMGEVTLGFDAGGFSSDIFLTTYADEERSRKATPVIGTRLEYDFDEHLSFYTSAYVEIAELFMQPYILISAYGGKAGFVFRGNT